MRHRLFNLITAVSLVLCIVTATFWLFCLYRDISFGYASSKDDEVWVSFQHGRTFVFWLPEDSARVAETPGFHTEITPVDPDEALGWPWFFGRAGYDGFGIFGFYWAWTESTEPAEFGAPFWAWLGLGSVVPVLRLAHRPRRGLCPSCGYDLRATPERCPECGAMAKAG